MRRLTLYLLLHCFCLAAMGGDGLLGPLRKVGRWIDNSTKRGVDSAYIVVPKEPWQVILRSNLNQTTYYLDGQMTNEPGMESYEIDVEPTMSTGVGLSAGLWVGYRGYGLGYQKSLTSNNDFSFSLSACGSTYGVNMRIRHHNATKMNMRISGGFPEDDDPSLQHFEEEIDLELDDPIHVRSMFIEGYYLFNGKRYSNTAVFDQSVQQVRSAGSLMVGATWFRTTVDYASKKDAFFVDFMENVGRTKQWQLAMGMGYAYNWVPQRQWLLSLQAMPMLTLFSRIRSWKFKVDYLGSDDGSDEDVYPTLIPDEMVTTHSQVVLSGVARAGVVYNHRRLFVTATGQLGYYGYKHQHSNLSLVDWYVNTSIGYRF